MKTIEVEDEEEEEEEEEEWRGDRLNPKRN